MDERPDDTGIVLPAMKDRVFRDPVHGLIEFCGPDKAIAQVLETRPLQRLRRIKQMGFAWLVYPGAEHSRFGHALGAFHMAGRVTQQLEIEPRISRHIRLAALLHDVGHGPFSHAWEQIFPACDHESWGARIVREDSELGGALESLESALGDTLCQFWEKTYTPRFARKLVSSQLDVDRLDYLLRDGHYSGAGYATYDLDWIIHALRLDSVRDEPDPIDLVVDYRRGMYAVEQYLFARSYMYAQVYHHKTVRAAEWMFIKILERFCELARGDAEPAYLEVAARLARGQEIAIRDYLWLDDISVTSAIDQWSGRGPNRDRCRKVDPVLRDLCQRMVSRNLFKTIDLGDEPGVIARIHPQVHDVAKQHFGENAHYYYQLDTTEQVGYASSADEELHVVGHPRFGAITLGQLLQALPLGSPVAAIRLVCAPELLDKLTPIADKALRSKDTQ